jgi:hypothetical protein
VPLEGGTPVEVGSLAAGTYSRIALGGAAGAPVMAAIWSSAINPHEVGRIDLANGRWSALSSFNTARAAPIDWQPAEEFWFESRRGKRIHNLLVKPPGFDPGIASRFFAIILFKRVFLNLQDRISIRKFRFFRKKVAIGCSV